MVVKTKLKREAAPRNNNLPSNSSKEKQVVGREVAQASELGNGLAVGPVLAGLATQARA